MEDKKKVGKNKGKKYQKPLHIPNTTMDEVLKKLVKKELVDSLLP